MKKIILTLFLGVCFLTCFAQFPTKGTGICYFETVADMNAFTPNLAHDCEWVEVTNTEDFYRWDRTNNVWVLSIPASGVPFISTDAPNGIVNSTTDGGWQVNMTTLTTSTALDIGGTTYPAGTSLEDIINSLVTDALFDHMNQDQTMDPANGSTRLHIVNGRLQYKGSITNADGFDIIKADGTVQFSVDF